MNRGNEIDYTTKGYLHTLREAKARDLEGFERLSESLSESLSELETSFDAYSMAVKRLQVRKRGDTRARERHREFLEGLFKPRQKRLERLEVQVHAASATEEALSSAVKTSEAAMKELIEQEEAEEAKKKAKEAKEKATQAKQRPPKAAAAAVPVSAAAAKAAAKEKAEAKEKEESEAAQPAALGTAAAAAPESQEPEAARAPIAQLKELKAARAQIAQLQAALLTRETQSAELLQDSNKHSHEAQQAIALLKKVQAQAAAKAAQQSALVFRVSDEMHASRHPSGVARDKVHHLADSLIRRVLMWSGTQISKTTKQDGDHLYITAEHMPMWQVDGHFQMSLHLQRQRNSWHFKSHDRRGQLATYTPTEQEGGPYWFFAIQDSAKPYGVRHEDLQAYVYHASKYGNDTNPLAHVSHPEFNFTDFVPGLDLITLQIKWGELRAMLLLLLNPSGEADLVELAVTAGLRLQPARVPLVF